ncbi:MAG: hypothetical protein EZS28_029151 [Streblomastix strix]|uniref:Uncharacterized protein n=1 Tax=Streblomastix strix TaxID=222440 RepID=A0A5J4UZT0_9EUKA|nr:MAG: hypothetical protein EZS28_029151 [Streblomastix strix]
MGKPGAGQHLPGYGEIQIEVQKVILTHVKGETISIADWRKFWKELDTDLKLDTVKFQFHVSNSNEQSNENEQSTAFCNNLRKRYRQDDRSNSGENKQNFLTRYNNRDEFRSQIVCKEEEKEITEEDVMEVAPQPPAQPVPATTSNTVVPELSQRQIGGPTPQLVRTPDSWKSNKTPTPKQQRIRNNRYKTQFHRQQQQQIPHPSGEEAALELDSGEVLVAHGAWLSYQIH